MSERPAPGSLAAALLHALAMEGAASPGTGAGADAERETMSLPRLGKRLQLEASVVMRELAMMGSARIGSRQGPGWVALAHDGERWMVRLTGAGLVAAGALAPADTAHFAAGRRAGGPAGTLMPTDTDTDTDTDTAEDLVLPAPLQCVQVQRQRRGTDAEGGAVAAEDVQDLVAHEVPVALVFNGISHAVMMATPQDLEAFALGFALSEGILQSPAECFGIETRLANADPTAQPPGANADPETPAIEVHLQIASRSFAGLKERRRALVGRTGCGVCGIDSLAALDLVPEQVPHADWLSALDAATVLAAFDRLSALQPLNAQVGSLHAAGWALPDGTLTHVMEDVGRHNALDKLLGRLVLQKRLPGPGFVVMSSRASYELARKCARLGVPALATISAPTALAIGIAQQAGMQLWGLCRGNRALRYAPVG